MELLLVLGAFIAQAIIISRAYKKGALHALDEVDRLIWEEAEVGDRAVSTARSLFGVRERKGKGL
jgi:hypothetical protein